MAAAQSRRRQRIRGESVALVQTIRLPVGRRRPAVKRRPVAPAARVGVAAIAAAALAAAWAGGSGGGWSSSSKPGIGATFPLATSVSAQSPTAVSEALTSFSPPRRPTAGRHE